MGRQLSLRSVLSAGTWGVGAAFALIFACSTILLDLEWKSGAARSPAEIGLWSAIIGVSGAMVLFTVFANAFFQLEIARPLLAILAGLSGPRRRRLGIPLRSRLAEWNELARDIGALFEGMASASLALEAENSRRQRAQETLLSALEDTSRLYVDLQTAYKDLADLQALDRLRRRFTNAVSHELRTPLTMILGFTEFLEDELGGPLSPEQQGFVAQIRRGARRLEYLVNDLLDYAALEAGTFQLRREHVDVADQVREVAEGLSAMASERNVALEVDLPPEPLPVLADPRRVGQVVANLIHNALKFTPKGGLVRVALRTAPEALEFTVRDSGIGIHREDLPRLFKSFSQLEAGRLEAGTGLGLSICRSIVEAHGGSIGVESTPGEGSTFWFRLPRERHGIAPEELAASAVA